MDELMAKEDIVKEAKTRWELCEEHESESRKLFKEDLRFANGDADNGYQWPDRMRLEREADRRPCLTINKVKQHNRQITNDARQNKPSIKVSPVDNGADKKTAEILNGIIRHIENNSDADTAYDTAAEFAVDAGIGYWRVVTDYAADDTFDQEIFIRRVKNPLNVYLDPDIQEADGSDAEYGFIGKDMKKSAFKSKYPNADQVDWENDSDSWLTKDTIRVCEYFRIVNVKDTLIADEQGNTLLMSEVPDELREQTKIAIEQQGIKTRSVSTKKVEWYLLAGNAVLEKKEWLGKYIPIVRVIGEEVEIDGRVERKGHTRALKDPQRMYNYWTSSAVEFVALQGKQPYVAAQEAIEGYEDNWDNLNTSNAPYLPYNSFDDSGNAIPAPQRQQPPVMASAYMTGMQVASEEMKMASGQYDASMGAKSNETSGRAIMARQRESDTATFHFIDNVARAVKFTGKILIDLIPKIYDTPRVIRILGEDGKEDKVNLEPAMEKAYDKRKNDMTGAIEEIYNPTIGRYDVAVNVGPSYTTRRQEAFSALNEMASRNPRLIDVAGDLIMKAADFPMADQLAERLERTIPPELKEDKDEEIPPQVKAQMQQHEDIIKQLNTAIENMSGDLESKDIDRFKAETERLKVEGELAIKAQEGQVDMIAELDAIKMMLLDIMHNAGHIQRPEQGEEMMTEPQGLAPQEMMQQEPVQEAGFLMPE